MIDLNAAPAVFMSAADRTVTVRRGSDYELIHDQRSRRFVDADIIVRKPSSAMFSDDCLHVGGQALEPLRFINKACGTQDVCRI